MKTSHYKILMVLVVFFFSCNSAMKEERKMFTDAEEKIKYYRAKGGELFSKDEALAVSYFNDSVSNAILNSYVEDYKFTRMDGTVINTEEITKPIYLQLSGRTCAPCVAELPALNDIVDKYSDKITFIMLETDSKSTLEKVLDQYNKKINLIYLPEEENKDRKYSDPYSFAGFRHLVGSFPSNYLINKQRKIVKLTGGAVVPRKFVNKKGDTIIITNQDAYRKNYERLEEEMKILLEAK